MIASTSAAFASFLNRYNWLISAPDQYAPLDNRQQQARLPTKARARISGSYFVPKSPVAASVFCWLTATINTSTPETTTLP